VLALCALASLSVGSLAVPFSEVVRAFTAYDGSAAHAIVRDLRVPRTELGLLVGAGVAAVLVFALGASGRGGPTPVRLALAGAVLTGLLAR